MKNITDKIQVRVPQNNEVVWDSSRQKVILFIDGDPVRYINLESYEDEKEAVDTGSILISGGGRKLDN